jgi:hypothetical protein
MKKKQSQTEHETDDIFTVNFEGCEALPLHKTHRKYLPPEDAGHQHGRDNGVKEDQA